MKLEQGQIWKQGNEYLRIVRWARMAVDYKLQTDPTAKEGVVHKVTKKEFCRLIKGAVLYVPEMAPAAATASASK
jgi:hypothetical protein